MPRASIASPLIAVIAIGVSAKLSTLFRAVTTTSSIIAAEALWDCAWLCAVIDSKMAAVVKRAALCTDLLISVLLAGVADSILIASLQFNVHRGEFLGGSLLTKSSLQKFFLEIFANSFLSDFHYKFKQ
tara:strand:+ start:125 stop:511 length:387 start_codon:yes stop_codon:yes gene_type:complete